MCLLLVFMVLNGRLHAVASDPFLTVTEGARLERGLLDPTGQLAYAYASATAKAGSLDLKSQNKSQTGHNIAVKGQGVDQKGKVVKGGGVSQVKVTLKPGKYTFYCSVPGHEQAGMKGELTVK